ncbi:MAG: hypothetical protein ACXADH_04715 [Candidatus Kariarchaeaceae archaeon]|jgi:hypothetical protein
MESKPEKMTDYLGMQFQIDLRIDGRYYTRIYTPGIPLELFFTDDYDNEEQAMASAKAIIQDRRAMTGES